MPQFCGICSGRPEPVTIFFIIQHRTDRNKHRTLLRRGKRQFFHSGMCRRSLRKVQKEPFFAILALLNFHNFFQKPFFAWTNLPPAKFPLPLMLRFVPVKIIPVPKYINIKQKESFSSRLFPCAVRRFSLPSLCTYVSSTRFFNNSALYFYPVLELKRVQKQIIIASASFPSLRYLL